MTAFSSAEAWVDLHTHSTASDGTLTPAAVIDAAKAAGLAAIALTDHDTGNGLHEAADRAALVGLRFVPGIEISAEYPPPGTLHILGYFIDPDSPALEAMSRILLEGRNARNPRIIQRLNELGCAVSMDQVRAIAQRGTAPSSAVVVGRPHIAQALVDAGCVATTKQAFDVYLGVGGAAYFDKERLTPRQAIDCIHHTGGLAVLAHPVQLRAPNHAALGHILSNLKDIGLDGIEVWHSDHRPQDSELFMQLARCYRLVPTGGSDFHGHNKPGIDLGLAGGKVRVPLQVLEDLQERRRASEEPVSKHRGSRVGPARF